MIATARASSESSALPLGCYDGGGGGGGGSPPPLMFLKNCMAALRCKEANATTCTSAITPLDESSRAGGGSRCCEVMRRRSTASDQMPT